MITKNLALLKIGKQTVLFSVFALAFGSQNLSSAEAESAMLPESESNLDYSGMCNTAINHLLRGTISTKYPTPTKEKILTALNGQLPENWKEELELITDIAFAPTWGPICRRVSALSNLRVDNIINSRAIGGFAFLMSLALFELVGVADEESGEGLNQHLNETNVGHAILQSLETLNTCALQSEKCDEACDKARATFVATLSCSSKDPYSSDAFRNAAWELRMFRRGPASDHPYGFRPDPKDEELSESDIALCSKICALDECIERGIDSATEIVKGLENDLSTRMPNDISESEELKTLVSILSLRDTRHEINLSNFFSDTIIIKLFDFDEGLIRRLSLIAGAVQHSLENYYHKVAEEEPAELPKLLAGLQKLSATTIGTMPPVTTPTIPLSLKSFERELNRKLNQLTSKT